ncbi:hypothetical protein AAG906_008528 [Vitis piasezkii]
MLFYLTTLNLVHVLKKECPKAPEQPTKETFNAIEAWKHSDFLCRNYILNGLVDSLYNVYSSFTTTRGLWETLEKKYKIEDAGTKKFIVECSKKRKLPFNNGKRKKPANNKPDNKKIKGTCWVYGKSGHRAKDCWHKNNEKKPERKGKAGQANMAKFESFVVVILESNVVMDSKDWWIDSGATRHIFKIESGEKLYMGNASSSMIEGKGDVVLNLTSGKKLTLMDILFVPEIRKNLVSASFLSEKGSKLVFESDKLVLTKGGTFMGKGYMSEGLFKLNVFNDNVIASTINKRFMSSAYIVESCELWNSRKNETIDVFKTYKNEVENKKNKTLKMLRFDRGGEYESTTLFEFCALHGIFHYLNGQNLDQRQLIVSSLDMLQIVQHIDS